MADVSGFGGAMTLPAGLYLALDEWSATLDIKLSEVPAAFSENYDTADLGPAKFSGSFRGKAQYNAASTKPFSVPTAGANWTTSTLGFKGSATLTAITGCTFTGTFLFHQLTFRRPHGGYLEVTGSFRNAAQDLTVTWDEVA